MLKYLQNKVNNISPLFLAIVTFVIAIAITFGTTVAFTLWNNRNTVERVYRVISVDKQFYVDTFGFCTQMIIDDEVVYNLGRWWRRITPGQDLFDPSFDTLLLVHSEEEAQGFPANVIVAWPSKDSQIVQERIRILNERIMWNEEQIAQFTSSRLTPRPVLDIEGFEKLFELTYPITTRHLVDNWIQIMHLWDYLHDLPYTPIEG
ncbi:MAG: hypothetical protein FWE05_13315 [Defluviitaleaceae bacterium]|nr:hypothetical protein [Defluviitaleaceae bacterium]